MKTTMEYIKNRIKEENKEVWELALEDEMELTGKSKEEVFELLQKSLDVMKESSQKALDKKLMSMTKMTGGNAKSMNNYFLSEDTIMGDLPTKAMAMAFSTSEVNASMGKIVASPTAGSAGIVPASLMAMREKYGYSDEELIKAILVATEFGQIIADNATFAGAEGGCQAECGSAAAMCAAAICYLRGCDIDVMEGNSRRLKRSWRCPSSKPKRNRRRRSCSLPISYKTKKKIYRQRRRLKFLNKNLKEKNKAILQKVK